MGAKTALLALTHGDGFPAPLGAARATQDATEALVRRIHPGLDVAPIGDGTLFEDLYPPDDVTYAAVLAGTDLVIDRRLVLDRPSHRPEHLRRAGAGRRIIMHGMHSMVDFLCFAVWDDGTLVRSLSLSPDGGVREDIGEPYEFELPYWAGDHPVTPTPGWPDRGPYPLPFHPLDLGEQRRCAPSSASSSNAAPHPRTSTPHGCRCTDSGSPIPPVASRPHVRQGTSRAGNG